MKLPYSFWSTNLLIPICTNCLAYPYWGKPIRNNKTRLFIRPYFVCL